MEILDDDALAFILLKLDLESVIRAAACCKRWLSLVCSNTTFVSQYRTLHGPVLGVAAYDPAGRPWGCAFGAGKHKLVSMNLPLTRSWGWKHAGLSKQFLNFYYSNRLEVFQMVGSGWEKHPLQGHFLRPDFTSKTLGFWNAETGGSVVLEFDGLRMLKFWLVGMKLYVQVKEVKGEGEDGFDEEDVIVDVENEEGNGNRPEVFIKAYDLSTGTELGVRIPPLLSSDAETGIYEADNKLMAVSTKLRGKPLVQVYFLGDGEWIKAAHVNYNLPIQGIQILYPVGATEKYVVVEVAGEMAVYDMAKQIWTKVSQEVNLLKPFIVDYLELFEARVFAKLGSQ